MAARRGTSHETELALVKQALTNITSKLTAIETQLETKYAQATETALIRLELAEVRKSAVTQDQFKPIKVIVYGAVSIILTTVLGAVIALVITRQA